MVPIRCVARPSARWSRLFALGGPPLLAVVCLLLGPVPAALAAPITVTTADDTIDANGGTCAGLMIADLTSGDGEVSLREAICAANGTPGADEIGFAIVAGGTVKTITLGSPLPPITDAVTIDGFTQSGARPNTLAVGDDAIVLVEIDAARVGSGLDVQANGVTIRGLAIGGAATVSFTAGGAIQVTSATDVHIVGCRIGLRADGATPLATANGVVVSGGGAATIGGAAPADRNVISEAEEIGVFVASDASGATIVDNYIGTDANGRFQRPNLNGLFIDGSNPPGVTVRVGAAGAGNLISGNDLGIIVSRSRTIIQGNRIGTMASGNSPLPNTGQAGVFLRSGAGILIGTDADGTNDAAEGNLISGNTNAGIQARGINNSTFDSSVVVAGNLIGTNLEGTLAVPNGVGIDWAPVDFGLSTIGGTAPTARNVISGNTGPGVLVQGASLQNGDHRLFGNLIGTNAAGTGPLPNQSGGVRVAGGANFTAPSSRFTIGGPAAGEGNSIRHNVGGGIVVIGDEQVAIRGNAISENVGLGIDLGNNEVTPNDPGDGDIGQNGLQNFPDLSVGVREGTTILGGTLNSVANETYHIDLFSNATCDGSGFGEGPAFLGTIDTVTNANGIGTFAFTPTAPVAAGQIITATATRASTGQTSEFSACRTVSPIGISVTPPGRLTTTEAGGSVAFSVALTSVPAADVTIALTSSNPFEGTVSPSSLTFTPANALAAQVVTVRGQDDARPDGDISYQIVTAPAESADPLYARLDPPDVPITNMDNDVEACTPRPQVRTSLAAGGGRLSVHVEATPLNDRANNPLHQIQFGALQNAKVTLSGQTVVSGQSYAVPSNAVALDFTVERVTPGQATTVPFTLVDGCGTWQTFVGGGTAAGF